LFFMISHTNMTQLGKYCITAWAAGNAVQSGTNQETGEPVSIKIIEKDALTTRRKNQLKIELSSLGSLNKLYPQGFPRIVDMVETTDCVCVVTEGLVAGVDLLSFLASRGRMVETEVKIIVQQIAAALQVCHQNMIIHHGIGLENILVAVNAERKCVAKLAGLDRCCVVSDKTEMLSRFDDCCAAYSPPEVFRGQQYDGYSLDIYSLGVVLYALLVGDLPFDDDLDLQVEQKRCKNFLSTLRFPDDISEEARDLVWRLLVPNPKKRLVLAAVLRHPFFSVVVPIPKPIQLDEELELVERRKEEEILCLFGKEDEVTDTVMGLGLE